MRYDPTDAPLHIAVVGAGPAGLMAARVAALRGHAVTLFERDGRIGGQLNLARVIPGKEEFDGLIEWFGAEMQRLGVRVALSTAPQPDDLRGFNEVIVATGVVPRDPGIPGQEGPNVAAYPDVQSGKRVAGESVAVVGAGGIGFDVATFLLGPSTDVTTDLAAWQRNWGVADPSVHRGGLAPEGPRPATPPRQIFLLQRKAEKPGRNLGKTTGWIHRAQLKMSGVQMLSGVNYEHIDAGGLHISFGPERNERQVLAAATIVLCAGQEPERGLAHALQRHGIAAHVIGGADVAAELDAKRAIAQGAALAARL